MATGQNYKNPPSLSSDKTYQQWKSEVKLWELVTDLDKKKRGLALALSLEGKAREVAVDISSDDLNADDGVNKLVTALDNLFEKDKVDQAYSAYTVFDKFYRTDGMAMSNYIIQFEQNYTKCKKHDMVLPDAILAFKLLDNASLDRNSRQMALTACADLKFDTMKSALNRIFASCANDNENVVKEESAFLSERVSERGRGYKRTFPKHRGGRSGNQSKVQGKLNPMIKGSVSRCRICDSKLHWVKDCPHKDTDVYLAENDTSEETVNITLFTSTPEELQPLSVFVAEAYNAAVIDTACTKTVCGSKWLHR